MYDVSMIPVLGDEHVIDWLEVFAIKRTGRYADQTYI